MGIKLISVVLPKVMVSTNPVTFKIFKEITLPESHSDVCTVIARERDVKSLCQSYAKSELLITG